MNESDATTPPSEVPNEEHVSAEALPDATAMPPDTTEPPADAAVDSDAPIEEPSEAPAENPVDSPAAPAGLAYGAWPSPITADLIVAGSIGLGQPALDGD